MFDKKEIACTFIFNNFCFIIVLFPLSMTMFYVFHNNNYLKNEFKQHNTLLWNKPMIEEIIPYSATNGLPNCLEGFELLSFGKTDHINGQTVCSLEAVDFEGDNTCFAFFESLEIDRAEILTWRNHYYCAKYLKNEEGKVYTYYNSPVFSVCPANTINCGFIDSSKNYLCLPQNAKCPIQDFRFIDPQQGIPHLYYSYLLSNNDKEPANLIFTRDNPTLQIAIDLKVNHGNQCSLYYERDYPYDKWVETAESIVDYNECATKVAGYKYNPNYSVLDIFYGQSIINNLKWDTTLVFNFPISALIERKEWYLLNGIYPANNCFDKYKEDFLSSIENKAYEDFAHGSFNSALVIYSAFYPLLLICMFGFIFAFSVQFNSSQQMITLVNSFLCVVIFPTCVIFIYYMIKMVTQRGDRIIKDLMGDDALECFNSFERHEMSIIFNSSRNIDMFIWQGVVFSLFLLYYVIHYFMFAKSCF